MTESPAAAPRKRMKVEPEPEGQLEQLLIANKAAHDSAVEANDAEKEYKQAIKSWLLSLFPDPAGLPDSFDITADPHGRYPGYTMTLKGGYMLDAKAMKAQSPETYAAWRKPVSKSWELREADTGGRR